MSGGLPGEGESKLSQYSELVQAYARATDLFGPAVLRDWETHLAAARAYAAAVPPASRLLLDLGSGGGLPGVPVAILRPELPVILCERREKRATFLRLVVSRLGLKNAQVFAADVRQWPTQQGRPDVVCAQAVAELDTLLSLLSGVVSDPFTLLSRRPAEWQAPEACGDWHVRAQYDALNSQHRLVRLSLARAAACGAGQGR